MPCGAPIKSASPVVSLRVDHQRDSLAISQDGHLRLRHNLEFAEQPHDGCHAVQRLAIDFQDDIAVPESQLVGDAARLDLADLVPVDEPLPARRIPVPGGGDRRFQKAGQILPVSYTHLTLPTIYSV